MTDLKKAKIKKVLKTTPGEILRNTLQITEIPYEYIATKIKDVRDVVADFGCGENLFKDCIPNNQVYSFDHVAIDDTVIACDMKETGLDSESIDVTVFSLALWGTNSDDYIKESYRILRRK